MLNSNTLVIEFVAFGAALGPGPYELIEESCSVMGMNWPQLRENAGGEG